MKEVIGMKTTETRPESPAGISSNKSILLSNDLSPAVMELSPSVLRKQSPLPSSLQIQWGH